MEPEWAQGKTDKDIRMMCRLLKVPGYSGMNRKKMIEECSYTRANPGKNNDQMKKLCEAVQPKLNTTGFSPAQYEKCVIDYKLQTGRDGIQRPYDTLECASPGVRPSVDNDSYNDCPLFYRRGNDPSMAKQLKGKIKKNQENCCFKSAKARLKAAVRAPLAAKVLYEEFTERMGVASREDLENQLDDTTFSQSEKEEIMNNHEEGQTELRQWIEGLNLEKRDYAFMLNVGKIMKDQFTAQFQEIITSLEDIKGNVNEIQKKLASEESLLGKILSKVGSAIGWAVGQLYKVISWSVSTLAKMGFNLVKFIITNPHTAKIMAFIALRMKKRICKELSIYMGLYQYKKKAGILEKAYEKAGDLADIAKAGLPGVVSSFVNGSKFDSMWSTLSAGVSAGFSTVLGAIPVISKSVPVIGGIIEVGMDIAKDAVKFSTEVAMYEQDVTGTFGYIIEIIDLSECIKVHEVEEEEVAEIQKKAEVIQQYVRPVAEAAEAVRVKGQEYADIAREYGRKAKKGVNDIIGAFDEVPENLTPKTPRRQSRK